MSPCGASSRCLVQQDAVELDTEKWRPQPNEPDLYDTLVQRYGLPYIITDKGAIQINQMFFVARFALEHLVLHEPNEREFYLVIHPANGMLHLDHDADDHTPAAARIGDPRGDQILVENFQEARCIEGDVRHIVPVMCLRLISPLAQAAQRGFHAGHWLINMARL